MSKRLSFSIAVNLLTENFKKGTNTVTNSLRSMQMQVLTFAAALGAGGLGISGLISRFKDVARETSRVLTALKNVSGGTKGFADNLRFANDLAKKYGLEINALTGNFAKFTASATQANMPMDQQKKVFESVSRAITAFGLSASEGDGVMLALSQMMGKGTVQAQEMRTQMGEKLPVALQAMAKAANTSIAGLGKLMEQGKVLSADVLPKFADALNEIIPNVDTDNLETSLSRLSNMFANIVDASGFTNKYKALIDGLTSLLESASKNTQNIIVGIVAATGFVVTNGLTKVYRGYTTNGQMIVANATITHNKLRAAIAARVEAEIALEKAKAAQVIATQKQQLQATQAVEKAKQTLSARTASVNIAHENAKAAAAQAAAIKSRGAWATAGAAIAGSFKKVGAALKSMWNSFAPAIIISGIIALGGYIKDLYDKTKWLEKATEEYNKDLATEQTNISVLFNRLRKATEGTELYKKTKEEILSKYGEYLNGLSEEIKSLKDVEGAYKAISVAALQSAKDRAIEKNSTKAYDTYTSSFAENATELQKRLSDEFGKEKGTGIYDDILKSLNEDKDLPKDIQKVIDGFNETYYGSSVNGGGSTSHNPVGQLINNIRVSKRQLNEELNGIKSAFGETSILKEDDNKSEAFDSLNVQIEKAKKNVEDLKKSLTDLKSGKTKSKDYGADIESTTKALKDAQDKLSYLTTGKSYSGENKAQQSAEKLAENKLEALRKLDEADNQRKIDKLAFDNDMRQKSIDNMDDGFQKEAAQLKLNYDKELQAIEEYKAKISKAQLEEIKNQYIGNGGDPKKFESYLKTVNLEKELPEGLKPSDVSKQVGQLVSAANSSLKKGQSDINKELASSYKNQQLLFASSLDQQLADLDNHYKDEIIKAKGNEDSISILQSNHIKERGLAKDQYNQKLIQLENDYKEKAVQISTDLFFFQSERDAALLKQKIANNEAYLSALQKEFKTLSGKEFNNLSDSELDELFKKYPDLVQAIRTAKLEQKGFNNELKRLPGKRISELLGVFNEFSRSLGNLSGFDLSGLDQLTSGIEDVYASFSSLKNEDGKLNLGNLANGIVGGLGIASNIITTIISKNERNAQIQREILKLQNEYNISLRQQNFDLIDSIDYVRIFRDNIEALKWLVEKGFIADTDFSAWEAMNEQWEVANKNILLSQKNYDKINQSADDTLNALYNDRGYLSQFSGMKKMVEISIDWKNGLITTEEALRRLDAAGMKGAKEKLDMFTAASEETGKWAEQIEELSRQMDEFATGTSFDGFLSDAMSAIADLKGGISDLGAFTEKTLKNAVLSSFKYKILAKALEPMYNKLADLMLADELDEGAIAQWGVDFEKVLVKYGDKLGVVGDKLGLDFSESDSSQDSSKGYSVSMDQDTGGAILGRITGIHEIGIRMESMLGGIVSSWGLSNISAQNISIHNELTKQTVILDEIKQIQIKSFFHTEEMNETLKGAVTKLDKIDKNTKNL